MSLYIDIQTRYNLGAIGLVIYDCTIMHKLKILILELEEISDYKSLHINIIELILLLV